MSLLHWGTGKEIKKNRPSNSISRYIPSRNTKYMSTQKRVHTCLHQHNSQKPRDSRSLNARQQASSSSAAPRHTGTVRGQNEKLSTALRCDSEGPGPAVLRDRGQNPEGRHSGLHPCQVSQTGEPTATESRPVIARGRGEGRKLLNGCTEFFWGDEKF